MLNAMLSSFFCFFLTGLTASYTDVCRDLIVDWQSRSFLGSTGCSLLTTNDTQVLVVQELCFKWVGFCPSLSESTMNVQVGIQSIFEFSSTNSWFQLWMCLFFFQSIYQLSIAASFSNINIMITNNILNYYVIKHIIITIIKSMKYTSCKSIYHI